MALKLAAIVVEPFPSCNDIFYSHLTSRQVALVGFEVPTQP